MDFKKLLDIANTQITVLTSVQNPDLRLEQAEYNKDKKAWEIVVSYLVEDTNKMQGTLVALSNNFKYQRLYKKIRIKDGEVEGIYIHS